MSTDILRFTANFTHHFAVDSGWTKTSIFNWFYSKSDNLVGVIGSPPESDWLWISVIHSQQYRDMTPSETS